MWSKPSTERIGAPLIAYFALSSYDQPPLTPYYIYVRIGTHEKMPPPFMPFRQATSDNQFLTNLKLRYLRDLLAYNQ